MEDRLKLGAGESLRYEGTRSKGFMEETDINTYSIINASGEQVGSVIHTVHTAVNGGRVTENIVQKDSVGKTVVEASW